MSTRGQNKARKSYLIPLCKSNKYDCSENIAFDFSFTACQHPLHLRGFKNTPYRSTTILLLVLHASAEAFPNYRILGDSQGQGFRVRLCAVAERKINASIAQIL